MKNSLLALAICSCLAAMAMSSKGQPLQGHGGAQSGGGYICGSIVAVEQKTIPVEATQCSCGGSSTLEIKLDVKGQVVVVGADSGGLVCKNLLISSAYDGLGPGDTPIKAYKFINNILEKSSCDTSDCGHFLWFFSTGNATCTATETEILPGGHYSYVGTSGKCPPKIQA